MDVREEIKTLGLPLLASDANTIRFHDGQVMMLDRRLLPDKKEFVTLVDYEQTARAIEEMVIQGAFGVAVAAGMGYVQAAFAARKDPTPTRRQVLERAAKRLRATRPTGQRLSFLMDRLEGLTTEYLDDSDLHKRLLAEVERYLYYVDLVSRNTGKHAADLLGPTETILTHCFAGPALLWMLAFARAAGKDVKVYSCETRPYLQGAKLTAPSIHEMGIPVTLICDSMSAALMSRGEITVFVTAADAIALDGSVANKVGTFLHAIAAHAHGIPFVVLGYEGAAPHVKRGTDIVIEQRNPDEVKTACGVRTTIPDMTAAYPAFDVTPRRYVSAIVFESGVYSPLDVARCVAVPEHAFSQA